MIRGGKKTTAIFLGALVAVSLGLGAGAATALPSTGYATWTVTPGPGGYVGTVALPVGFPSIAFTTDSLGPPPIGTGIATYISAPSAFGIPFGSSANHGYLSLRPKSNTPGNPSTTTFTFAGPTPVGGWGYVAGDIDAETITIAATDTAGNPVPAAALGVTAFNYCTNPGSSCVASATVPTIVDSANLVTAVDLNCTAISGPGTCDTSGESAWVNPTVALSSLTVTSNAKQGFAQFQNWFATIGRTISGTATTTCTTSPTVQLLDPSGAVLATSAVTAGTFSFPLVAARSDYTVREVAAGASSIPAVATDVSGADATGLAVTAVCAAAVPDPPELAATGMDPKLPAFFALILIALGIGLRVVRRSALRHR